MDEATTGAALTLRATGPATEGGRLPLAEIARLASGLQASLEVLALTIAGRAARPGRRPRDIVDAVRLDFIGFRTGSAVLDIARTPGADDGLFEQALDALERGAAGLREHPDVLPELFSPQLVNSLRSLTGGIGPANVTRVELCQGGRIRFVIDEGLQIALRRSSFQQIARESTIVGRLHMGDFSPATLRCRVDTYAGSVLCDFDSDLRDAVLDAMDEMVMAEGIAELEPNGVTIRVLHLASLRRLDSSRPKTLAELAREQGVSPVRSGDDLRRTGTDDMTEFLAALRDVRGEGEDG